MGPLFASKRRDQAHLGLESICHMPYKLTLLRHVTILRTPSMETQIVKVLFI